MDDSVDENVADVTDAPADSALELSDEDFLALGDAAFSEEPAAEVDEGNDDEELDGSSDSDDDDLDVDGSTDESDELDDEDSTESDQDDDSDSDTEDSEEEASELSSEDFVKQITSPFKANGKEMQVESVEDVVRLMQMGANYNQKMHAMKPSMKILKTLEKNGLLDESKLNFLIDLDKKNPEAIAKLLQDGEIDPRDLDSLDEGEEKNYEAPDYSVGDAEMKLNDVLTSIESTDTYDRTMDVVGTKWDDQSRQLVAKEPQLLTVINDHMASGVHDLISTEVDRARMLGRLDGMNDLEAYQAVGDQLHKAGGFNHLNGGTKETETTVTTRTPKTKKSDAKRNAKKRAASPTKASKGPAPLTDYNPLNMSDEEFEKLDARFT